MEPATTLSTLAKSFMALGSSLLTKTVVPHLRQLHAEHQAGRDSTAIQTNFSDAPLEATLSRLQQIEANETWWRELYQRAAIAYVRPDYLAKPSVREWLSETAVRDDLKALARGRFLPLPPDETPIRKRLADRYAFHTLEAWQLATGPIDAVVNILLAGAVAGLSKDTRFLAGVVQQSAGQIITHLDSRLDAVEQRLDTPPPQDIVAHTQTCQTALDRILQRRSLPQVDARAEISALAERMETHGDLRYCTDITKALVFLWAARLHASQQYSIAAANRYRAAALEHNASVDTSIVDAWLRANAGDVDGALRQLRAIGTADARSNTLTMLLVHHGRRRALEWFNSNGTVAPDFLTALGWKNAASMLAESEQWTEAANRLASLPASSFIECPDLLYVDGVINAALILPEWLRAHTLTMLVVERPVEILQGAQPAQHRQRALECFANSSRVMRELGADERATIADLYHTWLMLTDPTTAQSGRDLVAKAMCQGDTAVEYAQLAHVFRIPFDQRPLEQHLRIRELSGGLTPSETAAKLALYRQFRSPQEVARFLADERSSLTALLEPGAYSFLLIQALMGAGQFEEAQRVISQNRQALGEDADRLLDQIRAQRGEDVSQSFEERFVTTGSDIDLQNLCEHLCTGRDPEKLLRYAGILFERQKNLHNAHRVCDALRQLEHYSQLVDFLDENDDLTSLDETLLSCEAWALYYLGRLPEARKINDQLLQSRDHPNDAGLFLHLTVAAGEWERFAAILDREWSRRDTRDASYLLQLACLAGDIDQQRASLLMQEAVRKTPTDPELLSRASMLAYRLGQDDIAMPFLVDAARLSPPDGPVKTGGMRDLMEIAAAGADRTRGVQEALAAARIPLHLAAEFWNIPLARLLVGQALDNERGRDPRHRTVIPLRHGSRGVLQMPQIRTVVADITSLILATELELLPELATRFDQISIPWSTMELLLVESQKCRFHQPSLVANAKKHLELVFNNTLSPTPLPGEPPRDLVDEVGHEMAALLLAARQSNGRVVRPLPIHRVRSFTDAAAELGEYAKLVMTTPQLLDSLEQAAVIDQQAAAAARQVLASFEHGDPIGPNDVGTGPLFLDGVALSYLTGAGLLDYLQRSSRQFFVHPLTITEMHQLISTETNTNRSLDILSRLRMWLRDGIAGGQIKVMPHVRRAGEEDFGIEARVLRELVTDIGQADAVLIDDRMAGMQQRVVDRSGRAVPIIDTVDLLNEFVRAGQLRPQRRWRAHHLLRRRGFMCIPVDIDELDYCLHGTEPDAQTGPLKENAELRAIRENLQRLRSTTILQQPSETVYLDRLRFTGILLLRKICCNLSIPTPTAIARSDWIYRHFIPSPTDWAHTIVDPAGVMPPVTGLINQISGLLMLPIPDFDRRKAYRDWIQTEVLASLDTASPTILEEVADLIHARIRSWVA